MDAGHAHACKQVARIYKKGFDGIEKNMDLAGTFFLFFLKYLKINFPFGGNLIFDTLSVMITLKYRIFVVIILYFDCI